MSFGGLVWILEDLGMRGCSGGDSASESVIVIGERKMRVAAPPCVVVVWVVYGGFGGGEIIASSLI